MADQQESQLNPVSQSFADHIRAFHSSLPAEEQQMLEQVFALAGAVTASGSDDVQGYAVDAFLKIEGSAIKLNPYLNPVLNAGLFASPGYYLKIRGD